MTDLQTQAEQRHRLRQEQRERKVTREACRMGWSDVGREAEATYPLDQLGVWVGRRIAWRFGGQLHAINTHTCTHGQDESWEVRQDESRVARQREYSDQLQSMMEAKQQQRRRERERDKETERQVTHAWIHDDLIPLLSGWEMASFPGSPPYAQKLCKTES